MRGPPVHPQRRHNGREGCNSNVDHTLLPDSHVEESDLCNAIGHVELFPVQLVANLHSVVSLHSGPGGANSQFSVQQGPSLGLEN